MAALLTVPLNLHTLPLLGKKRTKPNKNVFSNLSYHKSLSIIVIFSAEGVQLCPTYRSIFFVQQILVNFKKHFVRLNVDSIVFSNYESIYHVSFC